MGGSLVLQDLINFVGKFCENPRAERCPESGCSKWDEKRMRCGHPQYPHILDENLEIPQAAGKGGEEQEDILWGW